MNKRDEAKQAMRKKILIAARQVFSDFGYEGTTFKAITALCDAGRQLIIYHFTSKEALWEAVVAVVRDDFFERFNFYLKRVECTTDTQRQRQLTIAFLKACFDVPEYGKFVLREGLTPTPRVEWLNEQFKPEQINAPEFDDPDYAIAAFTGLGNHIQTGALLYLANMGAVMDLQPGNERYVISPLSDASINKIADIMATMVESLCTEIKAERIN